MEPNWLSSPRADRIARLYGTKHATLREVGKVLQGKVQTPAIVLYLLQGILTVQRSEISSKASDDFVKYLEKDAYTAAEGAAQAEECYVLALLGDFGQQLVFRRAIAAWENRMWMAGGVQRGRLQADLDRGPNIFKELFRSELLKLARDLAERYDTSINIDELAAILGFVCARHRVSRASLTEANSIREVLEIAASVRSLCAKRWPLNLLPYQKTMAKAVAEYGRVVFEAQALSLEESSKVMRGGRFTGWLWKVAGLVKEAREERQRGEGGRDAV